MEAIGGEIGFMAASAGKAFLLLMEPHRLMFLGAGCIMGLVWLCKGKSKGGKMNGVSFAAGVIKNLTQAT